MKASARLRTRFRARRSVRSGSAVGRRRQPASPAVKNAPDISPLLSAFKMQVFAKAMLTSAAGSPRILKPQTNSRS
jgi:hypothetical protein